MTGEAVLPLAAEVQGRQNFWILEASVHRERRIRRRLGGLLCLLAPFGALER